MSGQPGKSRWIAPVLITSFVIILVVSIDLDESAEIILSVDWGAFLIGSILLLTGIQFIPLRWHILQKSPRGFSYTYATTAITYLSRMFLPVNVTVLRIAILTLTESVSASQITPVIVGERVIETVMRAVSLIIFVFALSLNPEWSIIWIGLLLILFTGFVWLSSHSDPFFQRLVNWLRGKTWLRSESISVGIRNLGKSISDVSTGSRSIISLLLSLIMGALFLAGYAFLFKSVGLEGKNIELLTLAAGVVFVLPPSTPQMIGLYQILVVVFLMAFQATDINTALVYGILAFGVQMIFWLITGIWGFTYAEFRFQEILQTLRNFRDERIAKDHEGEE